MLVAWDKTSFAERNVMESILVGIPPGSIRLGARELDDLCPLVGFLGDEILEVGRRTGKHRPAHVGKPRFDLGTGEGRVDFFVEPVDDLGGSAFGDANAEPAAGLVA